MLPHRLSLCNSSAWPPWLSPSLHHALPLSPTYRWWAHLCGCLSHLTTRLRSRQRHSREEDLSRKHWNKAQGKCWWCHHRVKLSTTGHDDNNLHPPTHDDSFQCFTRRMDSHYTHYAAWDWMWKCDVQSGNTGCSWWMWKMKTCWNPP